MMKTAFRQLYDEVPGFTFQKCGIPFSAPIESYFESGEYAETEEKILKGFYTYQVLNQYNLNRLIGRDVKEHVRKMTDQGILDYYSLVSKEDGSSYEAVGGGEILKPYSLSKAAHRFILDNRHYRKTYAYQELEAKNDSALLKKLSINQYHISVITKNKALILDEKIAFMDSYREMGTVVIPSLIRLKKGPTIFALPMFRNAEEYTGQIRLLYRLAGYLTETHVQYPAPILVWIAKSNRAAIEGINHIRNLDLGGGYKPFLELPLTYCLDYVTKEGNPLKEFIYAEDTNKRVVLYRAKIT